MPNDATSDKELTAALAPPLQSGTLFIVDDEMMVTSSLETMLMLETTHKIYTFNHPEDALEQLDALKPDVVVSDFSMPGMDGIQFLKAVKQRHPEATLILLTGYADKQNAIEAINSVGIYRYIEKPWDNEELKLSINNGMERSRLIGNLRLSVSDLTAARGELLRTNFKLETLVEERTRDLKATYLTLQSIVSSTADGILTLDSALNMTSINPAADHWLRQYLDNPSQPLLQQPVTDYLGLTPFEGSAQRLVKGAGKRNEKLLQLFEQDAPHTFNEVFIGDTPLEASVSRLPANTDGTRGGFVVVLRNITERKAIERMRDDFVSTLTHDLRTPLLAAIQTLGFFLDGTLGVVEGRQKEIVEMLIQSKREMLGLVNVLLEVYKYESGRQSLVMDVVDIFKLVSAICQELNALAQSREQKLVLDPPYQTASGEPVAYQIVGDKQELKRVFVNLIGNAINFTPKGGTVRVSMKHEMSTVLEPPDAKGEQKTSPGKNILVSVSDNGRGIPEKDIPLLFQRFSQGTSRQRSSGSGLGLYLSRQIVEAHQGHIWVESQENVGSQFYARFPASRVETLQATSFKGQASVH